MPKTVRYVHRYLDLVLRKRNKLWFSRPVCAQLICKWGHFQRTSKRNSLTSLETTPFPEKFRYLKTHLFGNENVLTQNRKNVCTDENNLTLDTLQCELVFFKTSPIGRGTFWENNNKYQQQKHIPIVWAAFSLFRKKTKPNPDICAHTERS